MSKGINWLGADSQKGHWQVLKGSVVHDFASLTAPDDEDVTISVPGVRFGDPVLVACSIAIVPEIVITAFVSAADVVTVRATANEDVDLASATYTVYAFHEKDA